MKRSEMIKHIVYFVESSIGKRTSKSQAERILDNIERVGMLPPKRIEEDAQWGYIDSYTWESEDEEI